MRCTLLFNKRLRRAFINLNILLCLLGFQTTYAAFQQQTEITVTGKVFSETKEALPGVTVALKGASTGTVTGNDGGYKLTVPSNATLVFSYIGFKTREVTINGKTEINPTLQSDIKQLEEVVAVGYGMQKKSHLTGSVGKLSNENLNEIPVARVDQALMGKMAGVQIQTTDAQAGASPTIQIRGATSITAKSNPLIVVDGYPVPTDLSAINMNDVESVEVLKDAASTAIYGSRGGNGVILITTKTGSKDGKSKVNFNYNSGYKDIYRTMNMYNLDSWIGFVNQDNNEVLSPQIKTAQRFNGNTDPQDVVFQAGSFYNLDANVSGSNDKVKYYISANALTDKGVVINNQHKKFGVRANVDVKLNDKFETGINFNPSYSVTDELPIKVHDAIRTISPWMPLYHNDSTAKYTGKPIGSLVHQRDFDPSRNTGTYKSTGLPSISATGDNNGWAQMQGASRKNKAARIIVGSYLKYNITKELSVRSSIGLFLNQNDRDFFQQSWAKSDPTASFLDPAVVRATSRATISNNKTQDFLNENLISFKKTINKHDFDAVAGFTNQATDISSVTAEAVNFGTDNIPTLNAGTMSALSTIKLPRRALVSALARVQYAYNDKYLLSVGFRRDGDSRFGTENRWGNFPSASVGWRVSQENFMRSSNAISELKLRASYGVTGNNQIPDGRAYANVTPVNAIVGDSPSPGFALSSYGNPNLGWERTLQMNTGFDLGLLNNRVTLNVDYYQSKTDQLLLALPVPAVTGKSEYFTNLGKVSNKGIEFELGTRLIDNKNFKWSTAVVGNANKNKLVDFGGAQRLISQGDVKRNNYFLAEVGSPLTQFYGYKMDSIVSLRGSNYWPIGVSSERVFVKDINGDGKIDENDRTVLGSPYPDFTWGFTNNFRYKSLDLSFVLQGSHGAEVYNIDPNYYENQFASTGVDAYKKYNSVLQATTRFKSETDVNVQDASFIALRNLNIGYTLPTKISSKFKVSKLRVYASAANLWYQFADNYTSLNPEGINEFEDSPYQRGYQRGAAPITRTVTFGLNLGF